MIFVFHCGIAGPFLNGYLVVETAFPVHRADPLAA